MKYNDNYTNELPFCLFVSHIISKCLFFCNMKQKNTTLKIMNQVCPIIQMNNVGNKPKLEPLL